MSTSRFFRKYGVLWAILAAICLLTSPGTAQQPASPDQTTAPVQPMIDPATGEVHSQRLDSGVPLGGIGAGTFQVMTDGAISRATLAGNWDRPTEDLRGCFAAIRTRVDTHTLTRVLALHSAYQLPTVSHLNYYGLYPQARLQYEDNALPVAVSLLTFSPLAPYDIKDSSYPAAAFIFRLHNPQPTPVEVSIALSWENMLGMGSDGHGNLVMDRTGISAATIPSAEGYFGVRFASPPTAAKTGLPANAAGEMTLLTYPQLPQATITTAGWNALDARPAWWDRFDNTGDVAGDAPTGAESTVHPAGVVAVHFTIKPNDYVDLPFAVAWYLSHWIAPDGQDYGHFYQVAFSSAAQAARLLLSDWDSLYALTEEWQKRLTFSNLPPWLVSRFINSAAPLTANSVHTRDGRFALVSRIGAGPPATPAESIVALHEHLAANALLLAFFPQLEASALRQQIRSQSEYGEIPSIAGDLPAALGPPPEKDDAGKKSAEKSSSLSALLPPSSSLLNADSVFVIEMAQYVRWTGDRAMLTAAMPAVQSAMKRLLQSRDADGLPALDTGTSSQLASLTLWLTALRAGQMLADMAQDGSLTRTYGEAVTRGAAALETHWWNGHCYGASKGVGDDASSSACDSEQLLGQWIAYQLGFGPLLSEAHLKEALRTLLVKSEKGSVSLSLGTLLGEAAMALWQNAPTEGVALLQRLDDARNNALRSPWQFPLAETDGNGGRSSPMETLGDSADWNLLYALEGFDLDLSAGRMALLPNIPGTWRTFTCPVFAPTFWGTLEFKPTVHGGVLGLRIDRLMDITPGTPAKSTLGNGADLTLRSIRVPGPPPRPGATVPSSFEAHSSVGLKPIGSKTEMDTNGDLVLTFDTPLTLTTGDRLEVDVP